MFKSIFLTATFKQSAITTSGTFLNGFLGAIFYIFLARILGPADFGILTVSIMTLTLVSDIIDFGTNTGLVRFVSSNLISNNEKALRFLKLALETKILVWVIVFSIGFFVSPFLAENIFQKKELVSPLRLVMLGTGGALFFSFATTALQSYQKYFTWSLVNITTNLLRLSAIIFLVSIGKASLINGLTAYIIFPFFGFFLTLIFIPTKSIMGVKKELSVSRQFFHYNFWVAIFTIIAATSSRLDTFLNARLLTATNVGIYGAANQLVQVIPQLIGALGVVAAPKFAGFTNTTQMLAYLKKFQLMVLGLAALGLLVIPASFFFIPLIFGGQYHDAVLPFIILLLAMLVFLISVPLHSSIIYYFGKPQIFVWTSIGHLLIIGFGGYILISNYGVIGAAISVLIGMIFNLIAPLIWFLLKIRK